MALMSDLKWRNQSVRSPWSHTNRTSKSSKTPFTAASAKQWENATNCSKLQLPWSRSHMWRECSSHPPRPRKCATLDRSLTKPPLPPRHSSSSEHGWWQYHAHSASSWRIQTWWRPALATAIPRNSWLESMQRLSSTCRRARTCSTWRRTIWTTCWRGAQSIGSSCAEE